jgi:hypothetical protein
LTWSSSDDHAHSSRPLLDAVRLQRDEVEHDPGHQGFDAVDARAHAPEAWVAARRDRGRLQRDAREIKIDTWRSIHDSRRGDRQRARRLDRDDKRRLMCRHRDRTDGNRGRRLSFGTDRSRAHHQTQRRNAGHQEVCEDGVCAWGGWLSKGHLAAADLSVLPVFPGG